MFIDIVAVSFNTFLSRPWKGVLGSRLGTRDTGRLEKGALQHSEGEDSFHHFIVEKSKDLRTKGLAGGHGAGRAERGLEWGGLLSRAVYCSPTPFPALP